MAIMAFKVIQCHRGRYQSKARMRFPISELIVTDILSRTISELSQLIVQISDTAFLSHPLGGLGTTYDDHLGLIEKHVVDFLLVLIEVFSLGVTAEAIRTKIYQKSAISLQRGHFYPRFQVQGVAPTNHFCMVS